jgi:hypothetical protein
LGQIIALEGRRRLAAADRCLRRMDRCVVRQLIAIGGLRLNDSNLSLATSILKNMLLCQHLMHKHRQEIEEELRKSEGGLQTGEPKVKDPPRVIMQPKLSLCKKSGGF